MTLISKIERYKEQFISLKHKDFCIEIYINKYNTTYVYLKDYSDTTYYIFYLDSGYSDRNLEFKANEYFIETVYT